MGTVDMDVRAADQFNSDLGDLNRRLESILNGINQCVETIGQGATGSIISQLIQKATEMFDAAVNLVNAFANLVNSIADIVTAASQLVNTITDAIASVGKFLGF